MIVTEKENGTGCKPVQEKGLKSDPLPAKSWFQIMALPNYNICNNINLYIYSIMVGIDVQTHLGSQIKHIQTL